MHTCTLIWILLMMHIYYSCGEEADELAMSRHIRNPGLRKGRTHYYLDQNNKCRRSSSRGPFQTLDECMRNRRVPKVKKLMDKRSQPIHRRHKPQNFALVRNKLQNKNRRRPTAKRGKVKKQKSHQPLAYNKKQYKPMFHSRNFINRNKNRRPSSKKTGHRASQAHKRHNERSTGLKVEHPRNESSDGHELLKARLQKDHLKKNSPKNSRQIKRYGRRRNPQRIRNKKPKHNVPVVTKGNPNVKNTNSMKTSEKSTLKSQKNLARRRVSKGQRSKKEKKNKVATKKASVKDPKKGPKKGKTKLEKAKNNTRTNGTKSKRKMQKDKLSKRKKGKTYKKLEKAKNNTRTNGTKEKMQKDQPSDTNSNKVRCKRNVNFDSGDMAIGGTFDPTSISAGEPSEIDYDECRKEGIENGKETKRLIEEASSKCGDDKELYKDGHCYPICGDGRAYAADLERCVDDETCGENQVYDEDGHCADCPAGSAPNSENNCEEIGENSGESGNGDGDGDGDDDDDDYDDDDESEQVCLVNYRGKDVCVVLSDLSECVITHSPAQIMQSVDPWKLGPEMFNIWENHRNKTIGKFLGDIDEANKQVKGKDLDVGMINNVIKYLMQTEDDCEIIKRSVLNINSFSGCTFTKCPN